MAPARPSRRTAAVTVALTMAAAVGAGLWWSTAGEDPDRDCAGLRTDNGIRSVLGASWRSDLPCGELADALRRATTGSTSGSHTLEQARAMRTVLVAVASRTDHHVHPEVRRTLAQALADYATDTHAVLTGINNVYTAHDGPGADAWQDENGVHVAVQKNQLTAVLRGLSEDPADYATLRAADLQQGALGIAAIGANPSGPAIEDPLARAAAPAGVFDAIAEDVQRDRDTKARTSWQNAVLVDLAPAAAVPDFATDPAGHLAKSWLQQVTAAPASFARLNDQAADLLTLWADATHLDKEKTSLPALQDRARTTTDRERTETLTRFKQGGS
ncbi:hypothetical protein ACFVH7_11830 [Kitasatospora indigofera]|uniref:hypothetical protein n=1 Tax=Kitasatospora indigofera TaxID=67307 RepID=UPI00362AA1F8